jgi:hypothetical protein
MLTPLSTGISEGLATAATLGLAAGGFAYAAMSPGSQLFGQTLTAPRNVAGRPGELALTFDDGPNPACTPRLLEEELTRTSQTLLQQISGRAGPLFSPALWCAPALCAAHGAAAGDDSGAVERDDHRLERAFSGQGLPSG